MAMTVEHMVPVNRMAVTVAKAEHLDRRQAAKRLAEAQAARKKQLEDLDRQIAETKDDIAAQKLSMLQKQLADLEARRIVADRDTEGAIRDAEGSLIKDFVRYEAIFETAKRNLDKAIAEVRSRNHGIVDNAKWEVTRQRNAELTQAVQEFNKLRTAENPVQALKALFEKLDIEMEV